VKPTVTTLLRQHQIIEKNEEKEKERVEGFLLGNTAFDFERRKRQQELQTKKEVEALDAKRRLKAKLAYHKAIAATKNVVSQKSQQANHLRHQVILPF
jgi:leucyl aminopeptidase